MQIHSCATFANFFNETVPQYTVTIHLHHAFSLIQLHSTVQFMPLMW